MRVSRSALIATASLAMAALSVEAFAPSSLSYKGQTKLASTTSSNDTPCAMPSNVEIPETVTAASLRSARLTNVNGEAVNLGEQMGKGTSISWCELQQEEGVQGPLFISIGDEEKLETFLEKNPYIPRDKAFVDGYNFDAYKSAGFGKFDEVDKKAAKAATKNMGAPNIGFKGWLNYFGSVGKVSPIPKDAKVGDFPEGVLRLGGTFVVKGDKILYRWSDRLPGDHPDIEDVMGIARAAAAEKDSPFSLPSIPGLFGN